MRNGRTQKQPNRRRMPSEVRPLEPPETPIGHGSPRERTEENHALFFGVHLLSSGNTDVCVGVSQPQDAIRATGCVPKSVALRVGQPM